MTGPDDDDFVGDFVDDMARIAEERELSTPPRMPPLPRGRVTNADADDDACDGTNCYGARGCQR